MPKIHTDEELLKAVEVRNRHRSNKAAAKELGVNEHTVARRLWHAAERGLDGSVPKPLPTGQIVKGVSSLYRMNSSGEWEERLQWVKTKADESNEKLIEALRSAFDSYKDRAPLIAPPKQTDTDLLSVYPIADQHVGLMAWGAETGEDYDLNIGAERLRNCAAKLVSQSPTSKQAIILNLGDWQHNDDSKNATPASGNLLDVDGRYMKVLTTGVQLMQDIIEMSLQKHDTVLVRNLPGNHDPHASIALTVALSAFYSKNTRVTVDTDPSEFFFHRFGNTLLGANHGHRIRKPDAMAMFMACARKEDWGQTKFHHIYTAHIHHELAKEVGDVRVESFQTLAAKDSWSAANGFCSGQSITSITHHIRDGEVGRHRVNV